MRDYVHWATFGALCEFLPLPDNRVTLADETDRHGLPVARFAYSQCDNDQALLQARPQKTMERHPRGRRRRGGHHHRALRPPRRRCRMGADRDDRRRRRQPAHLRRPQPVHHRRQRAADPGQRPTRPSPSWPWPPAPPTIWPAGNRALTTSTRSGRDRRPRRGRVHGADRPARSPTAPLTWDATDRGRRRSPSAGGVTGARLHLRAARPAPRSSDDVLRPVVVGADALDVAGHLGGDGPRPSATSAGPGIVSMAIAAVDIALWDLKAKLLDLPLARLLGRRRDAVPVYGSGGFTSLRRSTARRPAAAAGSTAGHPPGQDEDRHRVGRRARTRPAHGSRWPAQAIGDDGRAVRRRQRRLHPPSRPSASAGASTSSASRWFEEPVSSDDLDGLHERPSSSPPSTSPPASTATTSPTSQRMCAAGAVDVLQADVSRCAGITEWLRVAAVAAAHGLRDLRSLRPVAPRPRRLRRPQPAPPRVLPRPRPGRPDALRRRPRIPTEGALQPDLTRPGIGLELNPTRAAPYRID